MMSKSKPVPNLNDSLISFTFDTDWAPVELVEDCVDILDDEGIQGTFFVTNVYDIDFHPHEVAIHPNPSGDDWEDTVRNLLDEYPNSKGVRSHSLKISSTLYEEIRDLGFEYSSNYYMYNVAELKPFEAFNGLLELPIFCMDDLHIKAQSRLGCDDPFTTDVLKINTPGLKVFDFHPIHLFLNTSNLFEYKYAKNDYRDPEKLKNYINRNDNGTRDFFKSVLNHIKDTGNEPLLLCDISSEMRTLFE